MDTLSECTCAFVGCSLEKVLELAPCPPHSFYGEFARYAIGESLCSTEICKIAKRCLTNFPTNDSSQIIQSICYPTPPTTPTTTPITTPITTPSSSSTSTPVAVSSTVTPGPTTTPAPPPPGGLIALIVTLVLVAVLVFIVVILVVKYKRRGKFQISKWKWYSYIIRRNTSRKGLIVRKEKKTKVCFDNPNYRVCFETIESEEIQERSRISNKTTDVKGVINETRISTVEVDLHIKGKDEEIILDAIVTDEVDSVNLVEKKVVEKEKEKELVDTLASSIVTGKGTGIDGEVLADIDDILIGPASTAVVCEEHEKFETNNNDAINAQTKPSDRNELKKNITHCDGAEVTETIKENIEAEDSKTNGTAMSISDEPSDFEKDRTETPIYDESRDSPTSGRAFDKVADCENTSDMTCKVRESEAEISATDGVQEELEANDSEIHSSPETSD